jgi:hypothetical protein
VLTGELDGVAEARGALLRTLVDELSPPRRVLPE